MKSMISSKPSTFRMASGIMIIRITQSQISSARGFHERGGRPNPCTAKTNPENGRISTPLFQIFGFDHEKCGRMLTQAKVSKMKLKMLRSVSLKRFWSGCVQNLFLRRPRICGICSIMKMGFTSLLSVRLRGCLKKSWAHKASVHILLLKFWSILGMEVMLSAANSIVYRIRSSA